jgi:ADP-ribosyl-[dinitrogen reductase] hydrolase
MALHILYHSKSYKDAVLRAANLGGDSDTVSAVTGMLAGAYYGYSREMRDLYTHVQRWDNSETAIKAYKLLLLGAPEL